MDKQYKNLMEQQHIDPAVTAQLYETLDKTGNRRKSVRWGAVLAAACIALMIPLTVFAIESIFGVPKVKLGKLDWHEGPNGFSIRFDDLDSFPPETFPEEMRFLTEHKMVSCESWEAAEEAMGVDLLNNAFLTEEHRSTVSFDGLGSVHGKILYSQHEGQLCFVAATAYYLCEDMQLDLKAKIAVAHPEMDEEAKQVLLGKEGVTTKPKDVEISYEAYTTKEGIPVVILRRDLGQVIEYSALFAVDDVSYEVTAWVSPDNENAQKQILVNVLDGFKLK